MMGKDFYVTNVIILLQLCPIWNGIKQLNMREWDTHATNVIFLPLKQDSWNSIKKQYMKDWHIHATNVIMFQPDMET